MELWRAIQNLVVAIGDLLVTLLATLWPWFPLALWILFWLCAVDWKQLYPVLQRGGVIGVGLMACLAILVWGMLDPPASNQHHLFGLQVSNLSGKLVYVTGLLIIAQICGSLQLSARERRPRDVGPSLSDGPRVID